MKVRVKDNISQRR